MNATLPPPLKLPPLAPLTKANQEHRAAQAEAASAKRRCDQGFAVNNKLGLHSYRNPQQAQTKSIKAELGARKAKRLKKQLRAERKRVQAARASQPVATAVAVNRGFEV